MAIYQLDPIDDARWAAFLARHPQASVFHSAAWLQALRCTYDYKPWVFTTAAPSQDLTNGIVVCWVKSPLTGKRLVSIPFADHCQPLLQSSDDLYDLLYGLEQVCRDTEQKYLELRLLPLLNDHLEARAGYWISDAFYVHVLSLQSEVDHLFKNLHASCIRRLIRRAEREELTYEAGRSNALLDKFYALQILTRRRHGLPPQPKVWFRNLIQSLGEQLTIAVASKDDRPVAATVTLDFEGVHTYKYGCSDPRYYHLGGMISLLWQAICRAKSEGAKMFDLGSSAQSQTGLVQFKDRWGTERIPLIHYRYALGRQAPFHHGRMMRLANSVFAHAPSCLLSAAGDVLYRHIG